MWMFDIEAVLEAVRTSIPGNFIGAGTVIAICVPELPTEAIVVTTLPECGGELAAVILGRPS